MSPLRRRLLQTSLLAWVAPPSLARPHVPAPTRLQFPRDAGAHPDFATEWWYITGLANVAGQAAALGYQVTFFRSRVARTQGMQSRMAARQLLLAHAAVTDVQGRKLWHAQRMARWSGEPAGHNPVDTASASEKDTDVVLRDWSLQRSGNDLQAHIPAGPADGFTLDLRFQATQAVLLQGQDGRSRKGPDENQFSYYYSVPQLQATGTIRLQGRTHTLEAGSTAWLDHEWSQDMLPPQAVGWDWIGINLLDGSALTAFQLRDKTGQALWDGGSFRSAPGAGGTRYTFSRGEVLFRPLRQWHSVLSKASYPVEWIVRTPADYYTVKAVVDNQELDSRNTTGAIYWEGLCEVWDSNNRRVGRGYLEMTGYAAALRL